MRAFDGGNPPRRSSEADVTIGVGQNKQTPEFQRLPYRTNIRENLEVGRGVYTIQARDTDSAAPFNTIRYRIIGDNKAPTYFRINENSGDINLNTSLEADSDTAYTVSPETFYWYTINALNLWVMLLVMVVLSASLGHFVELCKQTTAYMCIFI